MKKAFTHFFTFILIFGILTTLFCVPSLAANGNIYFSDPSATVGSTVSVSMSVGDAVAMYNITLMYDSSLLQFVSGSGNYSTSVSGGGGYISVNGYNGDSASTFTCTLTFTALASGSANISVVGDIDIVNDDGDNVAGHIGSSTVTISNPVTASSDATLSSLYISPGYLSPSFSSGTTSYSTTVSSDTSKLTVSATPNDDGASVYVSGTSLSVGKNNVYVTVTAEDGTEKTYTIVVTRPAATVSGGSENNTTGTPETDVPEVPTEAYVTTSSGQISQVSDNISEELIPNGFTLTETVVEGRTVDAIKYADTQLIVVLLLNDDGTISGFYYLNDSNIATPMVTVSQSTDVIILADLSLATAPNGYKASKFKIGDSEYDAFVPDSDAKPDHCLVYGINSEGKSNLYCYDPIEDTYQRYGLSSLVEIKEVKIEVPSKNVDTEQQPEAEPPLTTELSLTSLFKDKHILYISIAVAVVIILLIALCIVLYVMYSRKSRACISMATRRYNTISENQSDN